MTICSIIAFKIDLLVFAALIFASNFLTELRSFDFTAWSSSWSLAIGKNYSKASRTTASLLFNNWRCGLYFERFQDLSVVDHFRTSFRRVRPWNSIHPFLRTESIVKNDKWTFLAHKAIHIPPQHESKYSASERIDFRTRWLRPSFGFTKGWARIRRVSCCAGVFRKRTSGCPQSRRKNLTKKTKK